MEVPYVNESRGNGSFVVKACTVDGTDRYLCDDRIHMYGARQAASFYTIIGILENFDPDSVR